MQNLLCIIMTIVIVSKCSPASGKPINHYVKKINTKHSTGIIHISGFHRHGEWEGKENYSENRPADGHYIGKKAKPSKPEWPVIYVVSALHQQANCRNNIRQ